MRLVTRNFNRPTATFLPSLWNEFFADDFLTKQAMKRNAACRNVAKNWHHSEPAVNIRNKEAHYLIEVAAPGFKKSDFKVELDQGILTISAQKEAIEEEATAEKKEGYLHKEFATNEFKRTFNVQENAIDVEGIKANYDAGVLVISIPKKEVEETKLDIDIL